MWQLLLPGLNKGTSFIFYNTPVKRHVTQNMIHVVEQREHFIASRKTSKVPKLDF